jgi:hypothetical protein
MCLRFSQAELSVLKFAARQYIILLIFAVDAKTINKKGGDGR